MNIKMNHLIILINSGEFISLEDCVNFMISQKLHISLNDFIKYVHINFFDHIDISQIYNILLMNQSDNKKFIITEEMMKQFNITNIKNKLKSCKLVINRDYIKMPTKTSFIHYLTHFGISKKEYILTPFAFKYVILCSNLDYVKYILLLDLSINNYINYFDKVRNNN